MKTVVYDHQTFALQQYGGISRYFCELASRIGIDGEFRARVVAPMHFNEHLAQCQVRILGMHCRLRGDATRLYRAVNRIASPALLRAARPDLVHRTYYKPLARRAAQPTVVTVFDMIHELFADEFPTRDPTSVNKRRCVEQADRVICISHSTADDLVRLFDVPRDKISVIHLALSAGFAQPGPAGEDRPNPRPYLLYVGHRGGYKNFEAALRAYADSPLLRSEFDMLAFGGFPFDERETTLLRELGLREGQVRRLTGSDQELARAYRHARALVYPSLYEGFGIPPLEAMSSGCAVACSGTSSIPEVVGDAAQRFDPKQASAIGAALEQLCLDDALHTRLVARGRERAQQFSWDRCALETCAAYRLALGG